MKWLGVTGSWKHEFPEIISEVEDEINNYLDEGYGVVSGGAPGVDYWATKTTLERFPNGGRTKIIIPTRLSAYIQSNVEAVKFGELSNDRATELIQQLQQLKAVDALIECSDLREVTQQSYRDRNDAVVKASNELIAFQVNKSNGVQYTVDKAKESGLKVSLFSYEV